MTQSQPRSALMPVSSLVTSTDPRAPKADITNARHLFGDAEDYGDFENPSMYGDAFYGEPYYGDVGTAGLNTWDTLIGDADPEIGGLFSKWSKGAKIALGAGGGAAAITALLLARKKARARAQAALARSAQRNTINTQVQARQMMGKIPRGTAMPFYQVIGATLNSYPLSPTEAFAADTLKYILDRQATDTPFEVEIVPATFAAGTFTATAVGSVTARYYAAIILTVGISVLSANPGTIFTVTGTLPTINGGSLVISTNPWSFTLRNGYYAKFMVYPWQLVTNKPLLATGSYSTTSNIVFNVTGLPSTSTVNLIVPGSQHPWTIAMRNRLL